ncbi:MAG: hypothetical protein U0L06_06125, partial [Agathobacter sp.]|nr:hypothetical protein [Agathobacter sp.]
DSCTESRSDEWPSSGLLFLQKILSKILSTEFLNSVNKRIKAEINTGSIPVSSFNLKNQILSGMTLEVALALASKNKKTLIQLKQF